MLTTIAILLAAPEAPAACAPATVQAAIRSASDALTRKDDAAARAAIAPAAACPVDNGLAYTARVLAADLAVRRDDWQGARMVLADVGVHGEMTLGARAQFLRMRADQGLGDADGFLGDRGITVAANDARLTVAGEKLETFRAGPAIVSAYRTTLDQGVFHRVLEFIAVPDDQAAYPVSILLTDDRGTARIVAEMARAKPGTPKDGKPPAEADTHAWFVDLYTCNRHSALASVGSPDGPEPGYAAVKARVVATLAQPDVFTAKPPERGYCASAIWLMPGFGLRR